MLRDLVLNFCLLVTLTYLLSLTYRTWPDPPNRRLKALRLGFLSLMSLALLLLSAQIIPGLLADLRVVPIALTTLQAGPLAGLLISVPLLAYRVYLGGAGVVSTFVSVLGVIALAALLQRRLPINDPLFSWRAKWPWVVLLLLPNTLLLPFITQDISVFIKVYLPVLLLDVVGFLIAQSMLLSRFRLLQLTSTLRVQANHDALTGLRNRREFDTDLLNVQPNEALILLDIDHFKQVNDQYGHQVGDLVLSRVGQALNQILRSSDQAYRYGGEEFAVLISHYDRGDPSAIAERIRQKLGEVAMPELEQGHITVSVGLAEAKDATTPTELLRRADEALYAAKQAGRNRVEVWGYAASKSLRV